MTDKEKLDKLVAEIERRKKMNILNENKYEEDIDLLSFIDTLEVIEIDADGNISEVTFNKAQKVG